LPIDQLPQNRGKNEAEVKPVSCWVSPSQQWSESADRFKVFVFPSYSIGIRSASPRRDGNDMTQCILIDKNLVR
jgi:hypothetical protein